MQTNYTYTDSSGEHVVPLAGFAYQTCDARDACVAAADVDSQAQHILQDFVGMYCGLGAPVLFACCRQELQWWSFTYNGAQFVTKVPSERIAEFFETHHEKFAPERIYNAKTRGLVDPQYQLRFVDIGLMPILEKQMSEDVARLMRRMLDALQSELATPDINSKVGRWLFQAAFWLLGAKVLKDKQVPGFKNLDLESTSEVLQCVHRHYKAEQPPASTTSRQKRALTTAAGVVKRFSSLANLTVESLAYVYENTLITPEVRKALGIHATPSYLVDYIVWQLAASIESIPKDKRLVLEPTCGHGPFLISAARLLRTIAEESDPQERHNYLKSHLVGMETDSFAREIARLSLTLADIPNPNSWNLLDADVYCGEALSKAAKTCTILLCNPPFQDFQPREKARYAKMGVTLTYRNKAAEVLARTLPFMPEASVIGVILPRGFLSRGDVTPLRRILVEDFEMHEVCTLPDSVFASADHESAVILGQKKTRKAVVSGTRYVRVRERTLNQFRERYSAPTEVIDHVRFTTSSDYGLVIPELERVWTWCQRLDQLRTVVDEGRTGKGLEYKARSQFPLSTQTVSTCEFPGSVRGYAKFDRNIKLTDTPKLYWMSLADEVIRRPGHGKESGVSQVLLNSAPVSRGPWRLKALTDMKGYPITSSFIAIRPKTEGWSLEVLWAILNSPLTNAYIYCHGTKRIVGVERVLGLPVPNISTGDLYRLDELVQDYFRTVSSKCGSLQSRIDTKEAEKKMLAVDAEVLRLYNLPPRLEREVLDLFDGWQRKGVDFNFAGYFPKDFESSIPLHEYLSEEYQRSTVSFVNDWVEEVRSPQIIKALEAAEEAFKED